MLKFDVMVFLDVFVKFEIVYNKLGVFLVFVMVVFKGKLLKWKLVGFGVC